MTKQEEIRDWMEEEIAVTLIYYKELIKNNQLYDAKNLDKGLTKTLLVYLHSQGVVILNPDVPVERCSFVEPLIEENDG